jgi:hypothetical protein
MNLDDKVPKIETNNANLKKDAGASGNTMGSQTDQQGGSGNSGTGGTNDDSTTSGLQLSAPWDLIRQSIYGSGNVSDTPKINSGNKPSAKNTPLEVKTEILIATETSTKLPIEKVAEAVQQNVAPEPAPTQSPDFQPKTPSVATNTVDARGTVGFDLDKVEANAHIPQAPANTTTAAGNTNSSNSEGEVAQPASQQSSAGDSVAVTNMAPGGSTPGSSPSSQQASGAAASLGNNANMVSNPASPPPKSPSRRSVLPQGKNTRTRTRSPSPFSAPSIKKVPQLGSQNTRSSAPSPSPSPTPAPKPQKSFVPMSAVLRTRPQGSPEGYQTTQSREPLKLPKWADPTAPSSPEETAAKDTAPKLTRMSDGK